MTIHIISVGMSLQKTFFEVPYYKLGHYSDGRGIAEAISSTHPGDVFTAVGTIEMVREYLVERLGAADRRADIKLERAIRKVGPGIWPPSVSAELDTFERAAGVRPNRPLSRDDVAVLVTTDTIGGLTAAFWNALALVSADITRVRYVDDCSQLPADIRGQAVILRVERLDASTDVGFREAMRGLGAFGRKLLDNVVWSEEPIRFYLSGGFKATIPYLIGLAEGLRTLHKGGVDALVLHEVNENDRPIRLPLRSFNQDDVEDELWEFVRGDGSKTKLSSSRHLRGYAYEQRDDERWHLTAFGYGLVTLFGITGNPRGREPITP